MHETVQAASTSATQLLARVAPQGSGSEGVQGSAGQHSNEASGLAAQVQAHMQAASPSAEWLLTSATACSGSSASTTASCAGSTSVAKGGRALVCRVASPVEGPETHMQSSTGERTLPDTRVYIGQSRLAKTVLPMHTLHAVPHLEHLHSCGLAVP